MPKDNRAEFFRTFNSLSRKHHKYDVFRDFVLMSSIPIHNAVFKKGNARESLEDEYLSIDKKY